MDAKGEICFCSDECRNTYNLSMEKGIPRPETWRKISVRTINKIIHMFRKENDLEESTAAEEVVKHTLMVHVKHQGGGVQEFTNELPASTFKAKALKAINQHANETKKATLLKHLKALFPPTDDKKSGKDPAGSA